MYFDIAFVILAIYAILFIHELGHLVVARAVGIRAHGLKIGLGPEIAGFRLSGLHCRIAMLPIGSACVLADAADTASAPRPSRAAGRNLADASLGERAAIYAAGPVLNISLGVALVLTMSWSNGDFSLAWIGQAESALIVLTAGISILIGLFNLLPIPPLDGGCLALLVLEAGRGSRTSRPDEALFRAAGSWLIAGASALAVSWLALRYWHVV